MGFGVAEKKADDAERSNKNIWHRRNNAGRRVGVGASGDERERK